MTGAKDGETGEQAREERGSHLELHLKFAVQVAVQDMTSKSIWFIHYGSKNVELRHGLISL